MSAPIRVALVDDQALFRAGIRMLVGSQPDLEFAGEAADGSEGVALVRETRPDVVLMDIRMPVMDGIAATSRIVEEAEREGRTPARIIVLTMHADVTFARAASARGAHGYLLKEAAADELLHAVETVMAGSTYLNPELGARLARSRADSADLLSPREREVLALLARGYTNAEVARRLMVSLRTVEANRANLRLRLGVHSRAEMVDAAQRLGLLS